MFAFRLRFLALLQFFFDVWRWRSWVCAVGFWRTEVLTVVLRGHLNTRHFTDFGEQRTEQLRSYSVWNSSLQLAYDNLARIEKEGCNDSGTLVSYAHAQTRHLADCERCQHEVIATFADIFAEIGKAKTDGLGRSDVH